MRFYVISVLVLIPLVALLSLIQPLMSGVPQKPFVETRPAAAVTAGDATRGAALYASRCYGCHNPDAKLGPSQSTADFKARYADNATLAAVVRAGRQPMPAFTPAILSDQDLADIIAYIRTIPAAP